MENLKITTVKEHNEKQTSHVMRFLSKKGLPMKVGFVVEYDGRFIYKSTKKRAEQVTVKDFQPKVFPIWYNKEAGMSNIEAINS
jgi:hypothetical protein